MTQESIRKGHIEEVAGREKDERRSFHWADEQVFDESEITVAVVEAGAAKRSF